MNINTPRYTKTSFWQKIALVIFGVFLSLILLEAGLRLGGFVILSLQELKNRASLMQRGEYRILCLGESTTQGQYPPLLEETLNQRNIGIKFSVIDKGVNGTHTWAIVFRLESYLDTYHPDMVITMMGINDAGPHMPYEPVSDSKAINFLKSFRIYKLTRLLWLHIVSRLGERKSYKLSNYTTLLKPSLRKSELQQVVAEKNNVLLSEESTKLKKAIELNPRGEGAYVGLGWLYKIQGKLSEAEESFKKAIELNPRGEGAYFELGWLYREQGKRSESEESFKKAIEINSKGEWAYIGLGRLYHEQGKLSEAEELFKKAIELNPGSDRLYGALEVLYTEKGNMELARKYGKEARDLRLNYYSLYTTSNYHKLKEILDKRNITYVCVQYPMRNLEPLKKIFQDNDKGIIFVDNERIFKDAVAKDGHQNYFRDMFGGDFGHCTKKGNRLLARNIAHVILKEVFGK